MTDLEFGRVFSIDLDDTDRMQSKRSHVSNNALRDILASIYNYPVATLDLDDSTIDRERDWADVILSTLKNFIEAAGGKLTLSVQYPTHPPIDIEVLSWLDHEEIE